MTKVIQGNFLNSVILSLVTVLLLSIINPGFAQASSTDFNNEIDLEQELTAQEIKELENLNIEEIMNDINNELGLSDTLLTPDKSDKHEMDTLGVNGTVAGIISRALTLVFL